VGKKEELHCTGLIASAINWIHLPDQTEFSAEVQVRYRARAVPCLVRPSASGCCEVDFQEAVQGVTRGQAAVFYRGDQVLGGGWIDRALKEGQQATGNRQ